MALSSPEVFEEIGTKKAGPLFSGSKKAKVGLTKQAELQLWHL